MNQQFASDIERGLTQTPKRLPSKYFYDEEGDKLFQQIMQMPEYYLTNAEYEIFTNHKQQFLERCLAGNEHFRLIEFGAGDGFKTKVLLRHFLAQKADFEYVPIDISGNVLDILSKSLKEEMPELEVHPVQGDYFESLKKLHTQHKGKDVVLFLGSNIGNFNHQSSIAFLKHIGDYLDRGDLLMVGADLKKHPATILAAYNDAGGITKAFNMNLLRRINRELGGDFNLQNFAHYPVYNPESGECKSFLVSLKAQSVYLQKLEKRYEIGAFETIYTEVSQKYSQQDLEEIASKAGFKLVEHLLDCKHYYTDAVFEMQ